MGTTYEIVEMKTEPPMFRVRICGTSTFVSEHASLDAANSWINQKMQFARQADDAYVVGALTALERATQREIPAELQKATSDDGAKQE